MKRIAAIALACWVCLALAGCSGSQMVVFYGSNSWVYTRLGHITDRDAAGMSQLLANGDVTVTITAE